MSSVGAQPLEAELHARPLQLLPSDLQQLCLIYVGFASVIVILKSGAFILVPHQNRGQKIILSSFRQSLICSLELRLGNSIAGYGWVH